ncbi:MAG TPA: DJ-1/PfpI family protein [bacterium]|nr:DJ-1/PfpI family protein [bacterium]
MKILRMFVVFLFLTSFLHSETTNKILMIIAFDQFRDEEYAKPRKILENSGYKIVVASYKTGIAKGMLGSKVKVDISLEDVKVNEYDGVIFVGGSGASVYFNNQTTLKIANEFYNKGKIVGAICIAPVILANAGLLSGKKATCWPSYEKTLKEKGAVWSDKNVEVDGSIITGNGPAAANEFGEKYLKLLKSK